MGAEQSHENNDQNQLKGMVMCGRDFSCGGCMDVDNKGNGPNIGNNAPLDANGQLTQPMRIDVKEMVQNQKTK